MRASLLPRVIAAALLATLVAAAPAGAADVYRSPGYKGTRKAPQTLPQAAPTPVGVGSGEKPAVLIDGAGTAHIVWNQPRGDDADAIGYCRLKRGAGVCDVRQDLVPTGPDDGRGSPLFNSEVGTPEVFALGDQLAIVTHRYPNPFIAPDGGTSERSTFLFVSNDGGETFSPGTLAGTAETSGVGTVFGPPDALRIGLVSDTQTGGPFFQEITGARYEKRLLDLGTDGTSVSLAPVGTSVMAAFTELQSPIHIRQWNGQGDIYDASNWSNTTVPGEEPRIAGGPSGTFMISRPPSGGDRRYNVRAVAPNGASFGAPVNLPNTENAGLRDIFQDPSGKLFTSYRTSTEAGEELMQTTSTDSRTWSPARTLIASRAGFGIRWSDTAATADGGGFAVAHESNDGGGEGPIVAAPFGTQAATGKLGLGSESGGAAPPDVVEKCARLEFSAVDIDLPEGCLLGVKGQPGVKVAEGTIKLNGLEIVPEGSAKILLNARQRSIDTTGTVKVQLRAPGFDPIVLFRGELHIKMSAEGKAAKNDGDAGCRGTRLASFDGGAELYGFPIAGSIAVYLEPDAACIPVSLELPKVFGGIRGAAVLRANNAAGLVVSSLNIDVDQSFIGPLLVRDVHISYDAAGDEWKGEAKLGLPPQPGGIELGAGIRFAKGQFKEGSLSLTFPYPGVGLDPFAISYLNQIRGGFGLDPVFITAGVTVGLLPLPPSEYLFRVEGDIKITFKDPITIEVTGSGQIVRFPLAEMGFLLNTDGFAKAHGRLGVNLAGIDIQVAANAFVDLPSGRFGGDGSGGVCFGEDEQGNPTDCVIKGEAVFSNKGIAACVTIALLDNGASLEWGRVIPSITPFSCDLDDFRAAAPPGGKVHLAQAGGRAFSVASRTDVVDVRLTGAGDKPPKVAVISPSGERLVPGTVTEASQTGAKVAVANASNVAVVGIQDPAPGTWQVVPEEGSPAITDMQTATSLPEPEVAGSVGGKARKRVLSYRASTGNGLTTTFVETGPMGSRVIGTAKGKRGTIRFAPAPGPKGKRTIEAIVERNGIPRLRKPLASYSAPPVARPGKVKAVKLTRRGKTVTAKWKKLAGVVGYSVRFDLPDGRHVLRLVSGKKTSVAFKGAPRTGKVTVTIQGRDRSGRAGPAARARR